MHILISNDDGIFANGIHELSKAAVAAGHKVTVFAPDSPRSGASHSGTFTRALHAEPAAFEGDISAYAVDGTPADCVRLGLYLTKEWGEEVDCVLSGINNGANRGAAILYSGTVAAATEASLCGYPAVAVSLCSHKDEGYEEAARLGVKTMEWAMEHPLSRGEIYNLNVPKGEVKGVESATVSYEFMTDARYTPLGDGNYKIDDTVEGMKETDANSDLMVTRSGYASLTILTWNRMSSAPMPDLAALNVQGEAK